MTSIYLITGFLGAGKTTFLKNFVRLFPDKRMRILVNEFGKAGIDGELLQELQILVDEISNGSIFCSCKLHEFETVLQTALTDPPDLIIIEASGLSDPTSIRKILSQTEKFPDVCLLKSICLVDALNFKKVIGTARVCKKQLSVSDLAVITKTDLASEEQLAQTQALVADLFPDLPIQHTSNGKCELEWLNQVSVRGEDAPIFQTKDLGLQKALLRIGEDIDLFRLTKLLELICEDTYRIKGFVRMQGMNYLVDCVGALVSVKEYLPSLAPDTQLNVIVALAGPSMALKKSIENAQKWYGDCILEVQ